ncbi:hypothetical protein [Okeania sp. SIO2C2]|uniref:hypothetical protein n=1 Tax=Okeania sp. SIO2C2 TaxID=2607787 RepID=UPI00257CB8E9|nr:hypothetical protein [Okeania sp. SIO2C2]
MYDINFNYLGVRSQESGVRREERRRKRKFFYHALIQKTSPKIKNKINSYP